MANDSGLLIVIFIVVVVIAVVSFYWTQSRSQDLIAKWAQSNGYELLDSQRSYFQLGTPFWAANTKNRTIYRITVRDSQGETRSGYALCGGFWMGLLSDSVEVKWDT